MKFKINKKQIKKDKKERKEPLEIILFVFSMCALTALLIFGTVESKKTSVESEEYTPVFSDTPLYDIFSLGLLKNTKMIDGVSDF